MKIFTSPASRTFNSINQTLSKSFSYDDKSYMGIENADLKHRIIKNSFSRSSNLSSKSYKRNLIYRVSASFIPSCVSICSFYHFVICFSSICRTVCPLFPNLSLDPHKLFLLEDELGLNLFCYFSMPVNVL